MLTTPATPPPRTSPVQSMVLDGNHLLDLTTIPAMQYLEALSLRSNQLVDLATLTKHLSAKFPRLTTLDLTGNPCAPSELSTAEDAERYRAYVCRALPRLYLLDSAPVTGARADASGSYRAVQPGEGREGEPGEAQEVTGQIHFQMLLNRFREMLSGTAEGGANAAAPPRALTYMQVKRKLIAEFGQDTFDAKKEHVRTVMQQIEMQRMDGPAANDLNTSRDRTTSFILERPPGSYALGSFGEYLWVKVRRPTRNTLGFNVVGGTDKAHGGAFVSHVGSTTASELAAGDRLLVIDNQGVAGVTSSDLQEILTKLPKRFELMVLRIGENYWKELEMELEVTADPMYELVCRGLSNVPLLSQLQIQYRGRDASTCCTDGTTGEVHTTTLVKPPGEKLGLKMAGAYELGGVFVTDINPSGVAASEPRLQVGCRVLEVNRRSVVFETQTTVGKIISDTPGEEISITFQVLSTLEWSQVCNHSAQDETLKYLAKAHEIQRKGGAGLREAVGLYEAALSGDSKDAMLRCQVLSGLGKVHFQMRHYTASANYHAQEVKAVEACPQFKNKFALCRALDNLGLAYRYCDSLDYAISVYKKELEYAKSARNGTTIGRAYANLGITYGMKRQYTKAIRSHEKSLAAAVEDSDRAAEGRAHGNLGVSHGLMKQYDTAIKHHEQRLAIAIERGEENTQFRALGNICEAFKRKGDTLQAKQYWDRQQLLRPCSATPSVDAAPNATANTAEPNAAEPNAAALDDTAAPDADHTTSSAPPATTGAGVGSSTPPTTGAGSTSAGELDEFKKLEASFSEDDTSAGGSGTPPPAPTVGVDSLPAAAKIQPYSTTAFVPIQPPGAADAQAAALGTAARSAFAPIAQTETAGAAANSQPAGPHHIEAPAPTGNYAAPADAGHGSFADGMAAVDLGSKDENARPAARRVGAAPDDAGGAATEGSRANSVSSPPCDAGEDTPRHPRYSDVDAVKAMSRHSSAGSLESTASVHSSGLRFDDAHETGGHGGGKANASGRESLSSYGSFSDVSEGPASPDDAYGARTSSVSPALRASDAAGWGGGQDAADAVARLPLPKPGVRGQDQEPPTASPLSLANNDFQFTSATSLGDFMN